MFGRMFGSLKNTSVCEKSLKAIWQRESFIFIFSWVES